MSLTSTPPHFTLNKTASLRDFTSDSKTHFGPAAPLPHGLHTSLGSYFPFIPFIMNSPTFLPLKLSMTLLWSYLLSSLPHRKTPHPTFSPHSTAHSPEHSHHNSRFPPPELSAGLLTSPMVFVLSPTAFPILFRSFQSPQTFTPFLSPTNRTDDRFRFLPLPQVGSSST
jgi:hypothetical protein